MASHNWGTNRPLENFLLDEGHLFDFYQAVRLLEKLRPGSTPVGENVNPAAETARFKSRVTMSFPASDIDGIRAGKNGEPPEVIVNFMGIAGAFGPLPNPFVELLMEREARGDTGFRDFLDIFNHRLVSLMYRVRKTNRLGMEIKPPDEIPFARHLWSIAGLGMRSLRDRLKVHDRAFLYYTGLLAQKPHSMMGLERVLSHYFGVTVKSRQFRGRWFALEHDQITVIGAYGQNQVLGENAVLGTRVWNQQTKFRLVIGPLKLKVFEEFLPVGSRFRPLLEMTRFYAGGEMDFEINLIIKALDVPPAKLSATLGPRLGWTSWIKTREFAEDDAQVVLGGS
ncbi:MAG TPA: type VI secretion system baseplate subunit TssG [Terriglobia bacterium]|jgi:type VI secretion system protein ImpH